MIVIPMAGVSRRFAEAGYSRPKFMLDLGGVPVFDHAVASFAHYFDTLPFLFVSRNLPGIAEFIAARAQALGLADFAVALIDRPTAGQAETVEIGLRDAGIGASESVTIFNIDTFRPGFRFPGAAWCAHSDGFLEVFRGSGANWSFVAPSPTTAEPIALRVAEKDPISDLCCTGLYHFGAADLFFQALAAERRHPSMNELYVAPIYNHLIRSGRRVHYSLVARDAAIFCGVPAEYEDLIEQGFPRPAR